jgi:hypothetical protein
MSNNSNFSSVLHDATIKLVTVDCAGAAVTIRLVLCDEGSPEAELVAADFTDVQIPRREPWGPSVSVNEISIVADPQFGTQLQLQLQSGDILRIEAGSISFRRSDRPGVIAL